MNEMNPVVGVYLAAGKSSRMGTDKLGLPLGGKPLGSIVLQEVLQSDLAHVVVVGAENEVPDWISASFYKEPFIEKWHYLFFKDAGRGQAYSLRFGLAQAIKKFDPNAVMVLLADQPFVTRDMINQILHEFLRVRAKPVPYVASSYEGIPRPPVLFDKRWFGQLMELEGDVGARKLLRRESSEGLCITFTDPQLFHDIDTKEQYQSLSSFFSAGVIDQNHHSIF